MGRNLKPAAEAGSVKVRGFCVRKCNASIWAESPMLQNLAPDDIPELYCDEETWRHLEVVHQGGLFPTDLMDIYKLLTLTVQLQLKGLTRLGLKKLFSTPDYWTVDYPEYISDEVVLLTFREPLNRLFRTEAVCQNQAREILYLARGPRMEPSVTKEVNSMTAKFEELQLERAELHFSVPSVPIMIMKQEGKLKTALCYRKSCKPFELFGKYSDLQSTVDIDAFHLKYASYLLYKSGEKVYFKNLKCKVEAVPYLDNCKFLISKKDNVLVVTEEKGQYHVRMWIENEEIGGSFAYIFSATEEIKSVDIESDEVFLILKEDGSLSVAERGNTGIAISDLGKGYRPGRLNEGMKKVDVESDEDFLILNEDGSPSAAERGNTGIAISDLGKGYRSASFHDDALYALHLKEGQSDDFEMHRFKRASAAQWERDTEFKDQGSLKEFAKGGRITFIGGEIFRISGNGLELLSTSRSPTKVLSSEEYVALSELHLHP